MEQARDWVDYAGLAFAFFSALGLAAWWWDRRDRKLQAYIASAEHRAGLIERHECRAAERYYRTLDAILTWTQRVYGNRLGWHAFGTCLTLAYLYPFFAALIAWGAANQTAPGGLELFRDVPDWPGRLWRVGAIFVTAFAMIVYGARRFTRVGEKLHHRIGKRLDTALDRPGPLKKASRWSGVLVDLSPLAAAAVVVAVGTAVVAGAVADAGVSALAAASAPVVSGAVAFTGAGAFTVACAATLSVVFALAAALAVAGAGAGAVAILLEPATLLAFFYILLPFTNALADWLSLAVTRAFLTHMQRTRPGHWGLIGHLALDLIAGLACLALLLAALAGLLDLWAWAAPGTVPVDWRAYWQAARADPAQGLALWLMCFTTLLPTLVHVVWALSVWQTQKSAATKRAVELMRGLDAEPNEARKIEIAGLLMRGQINGAIRAALFWGPPLAAALWLTARALATG